MTWNIFGHAQAVAMLKEHTQPEKLHHAYLLTGPQGVGRRSLALAFIKALNCQKPPANGEFCNQCIPCQQISNQAFPDLAIVKPEEGHKDIRIEQIRSLQHTLMLAPFQAKYRIALILDFQNVTVGASNALLKTLEEPPSKVVLILTADAPENLLPTISSRCEVLRLRSLNPCEAEKVLVEKRGLSQLDARLLAHITSGRLGTAFWLSNHSEQMELRSQLLDDMEDLIRTNIRERFKYVDDLFKRIKGDRDNLAEVISLWLTIWRDVLIRVSGAEMSVVNIDKTALINTIAMKVDLAYTNRIMIQLEEGLKQIELYVNPRLLMENLLLTWPRI